SRFGASSSDVIAALEPLLSDLTPRIRVHTAASTLKLGAYSKALELLRDLAVNGDEESRIEALSAMGTSQDAEAFDLITDQLKDPSVAVRRAALSALSSMDAERSLPILIEGLRDVELKQTAAKAIGQVGGSAANAVFDALSNPKLESGALLALEFLPNPNPKWIETFARSAVGRAIHYDELVRTLSGQNGRTELLAKLLHEKVNQQGLSALQAIALIGDKETIKVAIENLESPSVDQRANVLEALESIGERFREIIRPLMKLWDETLPTPVTLSPAAALLAALTDSDEWLRTCAAFAASPHTELKPALEQLIESDPDPFAREVAAASMNGDHSMDTLPTLPLMERILFFRRVPLFANLSTADLKQVAAISEESTFVDKDEIALQGETGDTMYIIVSGEIQVTALKGDGTSAELARRKAGEVVGEMAIISKEPRMASLVALGDVRTLCIDQKSFEGLLRERAEVSLAVMQVLCTRIKEMAK
ncbi:MAG TPA: HEAT repeat domain-containing protein, partial [Anaerolineales bacterium]|nr:HEAT repeat domain-containing protein [Anaerolineales bacterium]